MADEIHGAAGTGNDDDRLRADALVQLKRKRDFRGHVLIYALVNVGLWVIWAVGGAGFPWPVFPTLGWGIGIATHAYDVFSRPFSEDDVRGEMERLRQGR